MKIVTWNVNSIRARAEHVEKLLEEESPDIVCLQETKVRDKEFPFELFKKSGYYIAVSGQKSYNGVAIASKTSFKNLKKDIFDTNGEKRTLETIISGISIINTYFPRGGERGSEKFFIKLEFYQKMKDYISSHYSTEDLLILCGDFNVARFEKDVWDPELLQNEPGFMKEEREAFERLLETGLFDVFAELNPNVEKAFTWWDYRGGAFRRNYGMRIDYFLSTQRMLNYAKSCSPDKKWRKLEKPSDHIPLLSNFTLSEM